MLERSKILNLTDKIAGSDKTKWKCKIHVSDPVNWDLRLDDDDDDDDD